MMLDDQLCFALYSATHAIQAQYRPRLEALGLTYSQYIAMLVLWEHDGIGLDELGERLFLRSATLTPLVKRLEAAGFVDRQRSTEDNRRISISLTAQGKALEGRVREVTHSVTCAALDAQPGAEVLRDQLHVLRDGLREAELNTD